MSKMSRQIVVDASVAGSAGDTDHPVSVMSRDFLTAILRICHRLVWSEEIKVEWDKHASRFTSSWLATMQSKRKIVVIDIDQGKRDELIELIESAEGWPASWRDAAMKDMLLVSAAWAADGLVASNDDKARKLYARLSDKSPTIGRLVWVNACNSAEDPVQWLEAGARRNSNRQVRAVRYE